MKCPVCQKNEANKDPMYGVLPCNECKERQRGRKISNWRSLNKLMEYAATPFYKHMGLPLKPEEKAQEKWMKHKGLSYRDLQKMRNSGKNARFNNTELVNKALEGKLPDGPKYLDYGKQRLTRN